jgi:hypothetical protein
MLMSAVPNLVKIFWMGIVAVAVYGAWTLGLLWFYSRSLRDTIKEQAQQLRELRRQQSEIIMAAMAFKASNETHPTTGPAVLQQLAKRPVVQESPVESKPQTGVRVTHGAGL